MIYKKDFYTAAVRLKSLNRKIKELGKISYDDDVFTAGYLCEYATTLNGFMDNFEGAFKNCIHAMLMSYIDGDTVCCLASEYCTIDVVKKLRDMGFEVKPVKCFWRVRMYNVKLD